MGYGFLVTVEAARDSVRTGRGRQPAGRTEMVRTARARNRRYTCWPIHTQRERIVFDPKSLDDLARRLAESVPAPLRQLQQDMEKNFGAVLQSALTRMNLVTREEFDVQAAVLARSRARLDALAKQVEELEARLQGAQPAVAEAARAAPRRRRSSNADKDAEEPTGN